MISIQLISLYQNQYAKIKAHRLPNHALLVESKIKEEGTFPHLPLPLLSRNQDKNYLLELFKSKEQ